MRKIILIVSKKITPINPFVLKLHFPEDLMRLDQLVDDNIETIDINKSVLKVGCLFACLLQKKEVVRFKKKQY